MIMIEVVMLVEVLMRAGMMLMVPNVTMRELVL